MCRVLMVSKAGFYASRKRPISAHGAREAKLRHHILAFHEASKKRYGSRPIMAVRIMRAAELRGKRRRAFRVTTNSNHCKQIAENVLERTFAPEVIAVLNRVWAGLRGYDRSFTSGRGGARSEGSYFNGTSRITGLSADVECQGYRGAAEALGKDVVR